MSRHYFILTLLALILLSSGCGGNKDRGKNKDRDRPQAPKSSAVTPAIRMA